MFLLALVDNFVHQDALLVDFVLPVLLLAGEVLELLICHVVSHHAIVFLIVRHVEIVLTFAICGEHRLGLRGEVLLVREGGVGLLTLL